MKRFQTLFVTCLAVTLIYLGVRYISTRTADHEIDAFFVRINETSSVEQEFQLSTQSPSEIIEIAQRHRSGLQNFSFEQLTPQLNFSLNRTRVEVSWHLAIEFERRDGHWHPIHLDEFVPTEENT